MSVKSFLNKFKKDQEAEENDVLENFLGRKQDADRKRFEAALRHALDRIGDTDFYDSCYEQFKAKKWLSEKQVECLLNSRNRPDFSDYEYEDIF